MVKCIAHTSEGFSKLIDTRNNLIMLYIYKFAIGTTFPGWKIESIPAPINNYGVISVTRLMPE